MEEQRWKGPVVQFDNWRDLIDALETTYTISFKDACRILQASRPWANQYIKPFVPSVFVNSNRRGDTSTGKVSWITLAAMQLDRPDMSESVWFHTEKFLDYIEQSVVSCTKQTKSVPMTHLMPQDRIWEFLRRRAEIKDEMKNTFSPAKMALLSIELATLPNSYYSESDAVQRLLRAQVRITERTKAPALPVALPPQYIRRWHAPHDLKDYGDADETIYRRLFREGWIRIELQLQDEAGKVGNKVFYAPDPDQIISQYDNDGYIIVTEKAWQQYLQEQGK